MDPNRLQVEPIAVPSRSASVSPGFLLPDLPEPDVPMEADVVADDDDSHLTPEQRKKQRMAALMAKQKLQMSAMQATPNTAITQVIVTPPKVDPVMDIKTYLGVYAHEENVVDPYSELLPHIPEMPEEVLEKLQQLYKSCLQHGKEDATISLANEISMLLREENKPTMTMAAPVAERTDTSTAAVASRRRMKKDLDIPVSKSRATSAGMSVRERLEARKNASRAGSANIVDSEKVKEVEKEKEKKSGTRVASASTSRQQRVSRVSSSGSHSLMRLPVEQRAAVAFDAGVGFKGATVLHACAIGNMSRTASTLLRLRADANTADRQQRSPLMVAAALGQSLVVKSLLQGKADPQQADANGWTAVMYATAHGHARVATDLVRYLATVTHDINSTAGNSG